MSDNREKIYTSTSGKLLNHLSRLESIKKGNWYPISLEVAPTDKCNLNCEFCSVKYRKQHELSLKSIKKALKDFESKGLRSVTITGGGDPTMYKHINKLIEYCDSLNLDIGLITNGVLLKKNITQENLDKLTWVRVSLSAFDFGMNLDLPKIKGTLGLSYVYHDKSNIEMLIKIHKFAKENHVKYVRIVPDCLNYDSQIKLRSEVKQDIKDLGLTKKLFVQTKAYDIAPECYIGRLKPFLYTDGYLYQCSAVALYGRKFDPKWRVCHMKEVLDVWPQNIKKFDNSMCKKGKCFYADQNRLLTDLQIKHDHKEFI